MSDDQTAPAVAEDGDQLSASDLHALRIAVAEDRLARATAARDAVRHDAWPVFAEIRNSGKPQQEARVRGRKLALITIYAGTPDIRTDEDLLMLCVRPHELETYVLPGALTDERVIKLIDDHLPELVQRRIKPRVRAELQEELQAHDGTVENRNDGEPEKVATITPRPANGRFQCRLTGEASDAIAAAIEAGVITEDGEIPGQPDDWAAAAVLEAAMAAPFPDDDVPDPVPLFADEHGMLDPEKAAAFAMVASLGRGFTTPPIEAYRMIRAGGVNAERARAWLAEHGLDPADPREGKDTPWPLPVPQPAPVLAVPSAVRVSKTGHAPTDEQAAVINGFTAGDSMVIEGGAGAAKTTTLVMAAEAAPGRHGIYVAFNKAISEDAKKRFPRNVRCSTAHALAMGAVGRQYQHRLNGPRLPARDAAKILAITSPSKLGDRMLAPERIARLAIETIDRFCRSADEQPSTRHVPRKPGFEDKALYAALAAEIHPVAQRAWHDIGSLAGKLRFEHSHYLKLWQLTHPQLGADFILFDEAQDANPVILDIIVSQTGSQVVAVGDRCQAVNAWNGAVDAMDKFPAARRLTLSQSFRFGPAVAGEANKLLAILGASLRIRGFDKIPSVIGPVDKPDVTLCRTNAEAMIQAMRSMEAGRPTAIVGGGSDIRALAEAAASLKEGRGTSHPELFAFQSWAEVQDHAENDSSGSDLKVLVDLIDDHGPEKIIALTDALVDEKHAQAVISTAHKSKGREWDTVYLAADFREPRPTPANPDPVIPDELAMLLYVARTRAGLGLDQSATAWVDKFLPAGQVRAA